MLWLIEVKQPASDLDLKLDSDFTVGGWRWERERRWGWRRRV